MQTVFVNPERCIGCRQCEFACSVEHSQSKDATAALRETPPPRARIHVSPGKYLNSSFPNRCRHCDPAPCEQVCPTGAIARNANNDLVLIDAHKCIACAMCAIVCPFDAMTFSAQPNGTVAKIVATKCDGCIERVRKGRQPACVEACKVDALVYGDLNELIAAGRLKQSGAVLAASTLQEPAAKLPATIAGWREWGEATTHLNEVI